MIFPNFDLKLDLLNRIATDIQDGIYAIQTTGQEEFLKVKERLLHFVPPASKDVIGKFKKQEDHQRSLLGEVLLRTILSNRLRTPSQQIIISRSEKGKPYVENPDVHFNISHSGKWVVAAISDSEIGVDVEKIRAVSYEVAKRYFSKKEYEDLNKLAQEEKTDYFFDLWTLKESYLKLLGKGLTKSLSSFTLIKEDGKFRLKSDIRKYCEVFFRHYEIDPFYKLSVCAGKDLFADEVQIISIRDLLEQLS